MRIHFILLFFSLLNFACRADAMEKEAGTIKEPYKLLTGKASKNMVPVSPDPLVAYRWEHPSADDNLEIYTIKPQKMTSDYPDAVKSSHSGKYVIVTADCNLMFDFGQVNAGWLEFDCDNLAADVTCSISEFNEPARFNIGSEHPVKTNAPVQYGKTYRLELNKQLYEGVRYAWIHLQHVTKEFTIKNVRLICQTKPVNYEGSFSCNDSMLNRIWYTAAYTVRLNLLKDYFGAILMERSDRHSWTGDAHTSQAASLVAFGNYDFVRKNLLYTSEQYNGIESYSLYWVLSLADYFNYTNDSKTVLHLIENVCHKLDRAYQFYDDLPSLSFYGWDERLGGGFEQPNLPETQFAYRALAIQAWKRFADVLQECDKNELAQKYRQYAQEKTRQLRAASNWYHGYDVFALSDAINAGIINENEEKKVWQAAFSNRIQRVSYSPFNQYFIINAMARLNKYAEALNTIDDCWGGQIRYGATTFFEVFHPSWNLFKVAPNDAPVNNQCGYTSFTHPWSSGVLKWLSEEVLGIFPMRPGFSEFKVQPHLINGVTSVSGSVPTPHGTVTFSIDTQKGKASLVVPPHTSAHVAIPLMQTEDVTIAVNGKLVMPIDKDEMFVYLPAFTSGTYTFNLSYSTPINSFRNVEEIAYRYDQSHVRVDGKTHGNWIGKYGSKGYMLFSYDEAGAHRVKLPAECRSIILHKDINWHDKTQYDTSAALNNPSSPLGYKKLGGIITGDPNACWQTFTIDVDYRSDKSYKLSLYLVDPTGNRRSAVELFDLDNKRILMPVQMVRDYYNGKYLTFTIDRPVRIRICQVRGDNAVCSALFFD